MPSGHYKRTEKNTTRFWLGKGRSGMSGKHHSKESATKISESNKGKHHDSMRGESNHNWKGGISKVDKLCRCMPEYRQWRSDVFSRDAWTCKTCGVNGCYVTAHHIKSFSSILKDNKITSTVKAIDCEALWDITNGVTLCEPCHSLTDNYKGRANKKLLS